MPTIVKLKFHNLINYLDFFSEGKAMRYKCI
ncbi:hypothetical protein HNQ72_003718 [Rhizobium wenxiniae]|uniref:Uncharacterized protein n=1 Tax=Rhizobium wenxiniae TaxID=1737357 RepID=A0A7W9Y8C0_9HYPH|nr:hypothetical protein [Rhizobium wenxiniae]